MIVPNSGQWTWPRILLVFTVALLVVLTIWQTSIHFISGDVSLSVDAGPSDDELWPAPVDLRLSSSSSPTTDGAAAAADEERWLILYASDGRNVQRQQMIRATALRNECKLPSYRRFLNGKVEDYWHPVLKAENATYGDLIVLEDVPEDAHTANTVKTAEFFVYFADRLETEYSNVKWVTKVDTDTLFDAEILCREYLEQYQGEPVGPILIGSPYGPTDERPYPYASGRAYTLSAELIKLLAKQFQESRIDDVPEDILVARLAHEGNIDFEFIELDFQRTFDIGTEEFKNDTILIHNLKDDNDYLDFAKRKRDIKQRR